MPKTPDLSVIIVSYNTRDLTLRCLETLFDNTNDTRLQVIVLDNASNDGSAEAVSRAFPDVQVIASDENHGFAKGNNLAAKHAQADWLLLLNPDTETHPGAIDALLAFSRSHPEAGITGGRTVFPDGRLNIASCWGRITPWSAFCMAFGLTAVFRQTTLFNPEGMGNWRRDSPRHVDIVSGCFLMMPRALWQKLDGFDLKYWMYGEEADLCARAREAGYRPMITPDAQIMHLVGASSAQIADKAIMVARARTTLIRDHWPAWMVPIGVTLMWLWGANRLIGARLMQIAGVPKGQMHFDKWQSIWASRRLWLTGYRS